jgi:putative membrane protein
MGIVIFIALSLELFIFKEKLNAKTSRLLTRIDGIYGIAAILVVGSGILNWMVLGKGYDYYVNNTFFIAKFGIFIIVGLLSIYPTVMFTKFRNRLKTSKDEFISIPQHQLISRFIIIELILMVLMPVMATLMANGIDL